MLTPPLHRFFTYYMMNGQTLLGPKADREKYPNVKPETLEMVLRSMELGDVAKKVSTL